jgi:hypothetical protein
LAFTPRRHGLGRRFGDDGVVSADAPAPFDVQRIPASVGTLIFDPAGRLLVLKPNYKKGWTIPGGQIEPDGSRRGRRASAKRVRSAAWR